MNSTQMQYRAFMAVVFAALVVALAPIVTSGIRGESLPDALVNITDKSVTAFATLLGTIGGLLFRQSRADEQRVDNTAEAFKAINAAQASTPAAGPTGAPDDPVNVTEVK